MTRRVWSKIAVAALTTSIAGVVGWWVVARRESAAGPRYHWVDTPVQSAAGPASIAPGTQLRRRPLTELELEQCFSKLDPLHQGDPHAFFHYRGGMRAELDWPEHPNRRFVAATNSLGLRGTREVRSDRPELRVLVTGDSHTDGVCDADEAYPALLQLGLIGHGRDAEALNAGVGGYTFYNYLGVLERYLPLAPDVFVISVFGGNDFYDGLALYHLFEGTARPVGSPQYRERVGRALEYRFSISAQGPLAQHYFKEYPSELEHALAMANAVSSEIIAACRRAGIHPIFLYIPPACDVAWQHHAEPLDRMAQILELSGDDLRACDRLADAWIEALRALSADVLDMRPLLRARAQSPYWQKDTHIDLDGHRVIAQALLPLVEAACPPGFEHRSVGSADTVAPAQSAPDASRVWRLAASDEPLARAVLGPDEVQSLFRLRSDQRFDAQVLFAYAPGPAINSRGMLGAREFAERSTRSRVLLVADELLFDRSVDGEHCGARLEQLAELECLDLTTVGYGPYNYLGALEKHADLGPEWLVVVWNSANDFVDALDVRRAIEHAAGATEHGAAPDPSTRRTPLDVAARLRDSPADAKAAAKAGIEVALELERACKARGVKLLLCIAPAATAELFATAETDASAAIHELSQAELELLGRVAKAFSVTLVERGVDVLDLTGDLSHATGASTFLPSMQLSPAARQVVAQTIAAAIAGAAQRR